MYLLAMTPTVVSYIGFFGMTWRLVGRMPIREFSWNNPYGMEKKEAELLTGENWAMMLSNEDHRLFRGISETEMGFGDCHELGQISQAFITSVISLYVLHPGRSHDFEQGCSLQPRHFTKTADSWQQFQKLVE